MPTDRLPLVILGLGNVLCQDDGLGALCVQELLRRYQPPTGARVLDGGTLGLSLLPYLEDAEAAILVDAIRADAPAGAPVRLSGAEVAPAVASRLSPHQIGVGDLLQAARWHERLPQPLVLLGLVPERIGLGVGLTPAVQAGLAGLVERVAAEAARLGHAFRPRSGDEPVEVRGAAALAHACGL
jgi:hydrogenase maturation protease